MRNLRGAVSTISLTLLMSSASLAGSFGTYGVGILGSTETSKAAVKEFSLGYEEQLVSSFVHKYEVGMYSDSSGNGASSSGYAFYSVGVEVNPGYLVMRSLWGVGAITSPDSLLGGPFQFEQDLVIGIRDDRRSMIGLSYKHMSSAGIYDPNKGRNFIAIHVEVPW